jgi:hypothetical protein
MPDLFCRLVYYYAICGIIAFLDLAYLWVEWSWVEFATDGQWPIKPPDTGFPYWGPTTCKVTVEYPNPPPHGLYTGLRTEVTGVYYLDADTIKSSVWVNEETRSLKVCCQSNSFCTDSRTYFASYIKVDFKGFWRLSLPLKNRWVDGPELQITRRHGTTKKNSVALSLQANCIDWATATGRRILVRTFADRGGVAWSAQRIPTVVNLRFLDREPLLFFSSSSSFIVTRLNGPRSWPTATQKIL